MVSSALRPTLLGGCTVAVSAAACALFQLTPLGVEPVLRAQAVVDAGWLEAPTSAFRSATQVQGESIRTLSAILLLIAIVAAIVPAISFCTLVLTRYTQRKTELATRAALGAAPRTLLHELIAPVLRLVWLSTLAGLAVGSVLISAAVLGWQGPVSRGLAHALVAGLGGGLACALLLLLASGVTLWLFVLRGSLADALRAGERATASLGETRVREALTVLQIGASVVLLAIALVLARESPIKRTTATNTTSASARSDSLLVTAGVLSLPPAASRVRRAQRLEQVLRMAHAQPGVHSESIASAGALVGIGLNDRLYTECDNCMYSLGPMPIALIVVPMHSVGPQYFTLLGARLLRGRDFMAGDRMQAQPVVIVNDAFVRRMFGPGGSGLGRVVRLQTGFGQAHHIIGVVADAPGQAPGAPPANRPAIYFSALQHPPLAFDLLRQMPVRADPAPVPDGQLKWGVSALLRDVRAAARTPLLLAAYALRVLAVLCVLLGAFGLHATTSTLLQGRRRDLAIRVALGCTATGLRRHVAGYALRLAGVGLLLGAMGALAAQRILETTLPHARIDARAWMLLAVLLTLAALTGAVGPTWKAASVR
ncbi:MAG: FtsX-like permease family protein [Longimicrobiales bacterium]